MEADRPRRRRARIVCRRCHEKKVRCDLQRVGATCSACVDADESCEFRPSGKGHHRKKAIDTVGTRPSQDQTVGSEQSAVQIPPIASGGGNYVRALLGHQSRLQSVANINGDQVVHRQASENFMPGALQTYLETYSEVCYTWCPIIDLDDSLDSSLLSHSLAAVASMLKPSLMPSLSSSQEHYERARYLFFADREQIALTKVKSALLLSCCNNSQMGSSTDSSFWWLE